jgi:peptidase M23-like protein
VLWLIQLLLPLVLLLWLLQWPAKHILLRVLQIAGTGMILFALHFAGLWMMPPWWTPWVFWVVFAIAFWRGCGFGGPARLGGLGYSLAIFWAGLGGLGGWVALEALRARMPPDGNIAILGLPLPEGRYYVANGGSHEIVNAHLRTRGRRTTGQLNYWGQSYGVDLISLDRVGFPADSIAPHNPSDYHIFGTPVLAPCAGRIVHTHDGVSDGVPVNMSDATSKVGNYALIRCGTFDILLAHFRKDSLQVGLGDLVYEGQVVGAVGTSGASDMPHLHIHAQHPGTANAPFSGEPVPMLIAGRYLVRGDRL